MNRQSTENFQGNENTLYGFIIIGKYYYTFVQTQRVHNTKSELCGFINGNKCSTLVEDINNGEAMHVQEQEVCGNLHTKKQEDQY